MFETAYLLFDDDQLFFISAAHPTPPTPTPSIYKQPFEGRCRKAAVVLIERANHRWPHFDLVVSYETNPISHQDVLDTLLRPKEVSTSIRNAFIAQGSMADTLAMPVAYQSMSKEHIIGKLFQYRD